jgi:hypothetical protein
MGSKYVHKENILIIDERIKWNNFNRTNVYTYSNDNITSLVSSVRIMTYIFYSGGYKNF